MYLQREVSLAYVLSSVVAILMAAASAIGLGYRTSIYPTEDLLQSFLSNDVVSLVIGVPILCGSM